MSEQIESQSIFLTGSTGYLGSRLIPKLLARGHEVRALARPSSGWKVPEGCTLVEGNALDSASYSALIPPARTFVHLVGVSHPNPSKAAQFRTVDLVSTREALFSALDAGISHFVYVSVAHPAPVMKAYIEVRMECEALVRNSEINATILRPWYVLGPGHRWPYLLLPIYRLLEVFPQTREGARRLGLVTIGEMVNAVISAIEHPPQGVRICEVPDIRRLGN